MTDAITSLRFGIETTTEKTLTIEFKTLYAHTAKKLKLQTQKRTIHEVEDEAEEAEEEGKESTKPSGEEQSTNDPTNEPAKKKRKVSDRVTSEMFLEADRNLHASRWNDVISKILDREQSVKSALVVGKRRKKQADKQEKDAPEPEVSNTTSQASTTTTTSNAEEKKKGDNYEYTEWMDDTAYDGLVFDEEGDLEDSESEAQGAEIVQFEIDDESDTEEKPKAVAASTNEPANTIPATSAGEKKKDDVATRNEEPLHTRMEQAVQLLKSRATELNMPAAKQIPKEFDKEFSVIAGLRQELYARGVPANLLKALKQIPTFAQISDATFKSHLKKLLQTTDVNAVKRDIDTLKQKVKDSVRTDMQKAVDKRGSEKAKDAKTPAAPATTDAKQEKKLDDKERQNLEKKGLEKEYIDLIAQFKSSGCKYIWSTATKAAFVELIDKVIENAARQNLIRESKESSEKEVKDICNDIKIFWPSTQQLQQKYKSFKEGKKPSEKSNKDDKGGDTKKDESATMAPPSDASTSEPKKKKKSKKQTEATTTTTPTATPNNPTPPTAKKPEKKRKRTSIPKDGNSSSSAPATPVSTPIAATPVPPQPLQQPQPQPQLQQPQLQQPPLQQHIPMSHSSIMTSLYSLNPTMQMRQYPMQMYASPNRGAMQPHHLLTHVDQSPTRNIMMMQPSPLRSPQPTNIHLQKQPPPAGNKP